jgi:hypothetical protein
LSVRLLKQESSPAETIRLYPAAVPQPAAPGSGPRLEGKGVVLDRGEYSLKFSLPGLNDADTSAIGPAAKPESFWGKLGGGKLEVIFRTGK